MKKTKNTLKPEPNPMLSRLLAKQWRRDLRRRVQTKPPKHHIRTGGGWTY